jgi:hypothetical protein
MKDLGDLILQIGLGAAAIAAMLYITIILVKFITKDLSGKVDSLYEAITKLTEEVMRKK